MSSKVDKEWPAENKNERQGSNGVEALVVVRFTTIEVEGGKGNKAFGTIVQYITTLIQKSGHHNSTKPLLIVRTEL